jgi:hypothetical protein
MSVDTFLIAIGQPSADGEPQSGTGIPIALIERIFAVHIDSRQNMDDTRFWRVSYPVDPDFVDGVPVFCGTEMIFSDEDGDGLTSSITFKGICGDDTFHAQLFALMQATPSFYLATGDARPAIVHPEMTGWLPEGLIDGLGPPVLIKTPADFSAIPEAMPAPRKSLPPRIEEAHIYARSLQTRTQERHRVHNLLRHHRALAETIVTADSAVLKEHVAMLDRAIAASWPANDPQWMKRVTKAVASQVRLDGQTQAERPRCGDARIDHARDDIAQNLGALARSDAAIAAQEAALKTAAGARIEGLAAEGLSALLRRLGEHLIWRMPDGAAGLGRDLYLTVEAATMFDVHEIEKPRVNVGSLHDDINELGKLLTDCDRPISPVDVSRMGHLLLALAARM